MRLAGAEDALSDAFATALAVGESLHGAAGTTLVVIYPIADLLLLILLTGALAVNASGLM